MKQRRSAPAFTLVELIIVMGLLALVAALAVPSLSGSTRQRTLNDEAMRFLSLVEYCRSEAIPQGVQRPSWIDPKVKTSGSNHGPVTTARTVEPVNTGLIRT